MTISNKTRKILWGKSGNRCAYCKTELTMDGSHNVPAAVIGDECHIISKQPKGPRGQFEVNIDYDGYSNLILLCKIHHKLIDDQPQTYTVKRLKELKNVHETWVRETLEKGAIKISSYGTDSSELKDLFLSRIVSGKQLISLIRGADIYQFSNIELTNQETTDYVADFFSNVQDWGDILDEMNFGDIVQLEYTFNEKLEILQQCDLLVFGLRIKQMLEIYGITGLWDVCYIRIVTKDDPTIIKIDLTDINVP